MRVRFCPSVKNTSPWAKSTDGVTFVERGKAISSSRTRPHLKYPEGDRIPSCRPDYAPVGWQAASRVLQQCAPSAFRTSVPRSAPPE
ncbi:hypothetical protein SKAU_G00117970 [Synaphobranchus kaupii]|uniref:Uncharacterized protein n=1 Tax=Synaphobranchus kaupii TaxID=118154 RepID=A0A9Q1FMZ3_SYNKA|nr:hypothetical protein SKAU_G00117970 [Synaphobranchus kaupii]